MKLNCDLGESFGSWQKGLDSEVMPYLDMANIACGFHAGDPLTMLKTIKLATANNVTIGAHPGYQDLVGFGRRSIKYTDNELAALIQYQIGALQAICQSEGAKVSYVKPHGALYNDMMKDLSLFEVVCQAVSSVRLDLPLVIQALPEPAPFETIANKYQLSLLFEAFADRNYLDDGLLVPRAGHKYSSQAVLSDDKQVEDRCLYLLENNALTSVTGKPLSLQVDTLCVHGDNPAAVTLVKKLNQLINQHQS